MKEIRCKLCNEIVGYNETGELGGQEAMFCKNRPHRYNKKWKVE